MTTTCDTCRYAAWSADTPYGHCTAPLPAMVVRSKQRDIRRGRAIVCACHCTIRRDVPTPTPRVGRKAKPVMQPGMLQMEMFPEIGAHA